jgi:hypothetical protein
MNGKIYEEIKKQGDSKRKDKLKFLAAIVSTNLLTICLTLSFKSGTEPGPAFAAQKSETSNHPHFKMIVTPLIVLVDRTSGASEIPITLVSKSKKIIIEKAYLHEEVPGQSKDLGGSTARFKIEIPEDEVLKLSADEAELMIAIPQVNVFVKEKKLITKRVSHYEVSL